MKSYGFTKHLILNFIVFSFLIVLTVVFSSIFLRSKTHATGTTKYARATGGNWSADATWSTTSNGAADTTAPTSSDNVVFDNFSGDVTIDAAAAARSINMNGGAGYTGILTHNAGITLSIGDASGGGLDFTGAWTYTLGNATTSALKFVSTSNNGGSGWPITWGGKTPGNLTFDGAGFNYVYGKWVFQDGYTNTDQVLTLSAGELDVNGQTISIGKFSPANENYAILTLGNSDLTINTASGWSANTRFDWILNAGTSTITYVGAAGNFYGGNHTYYDVIISGTGIPTIYDTNTFNNLTRTGTAVKTEGIAFAYDQTITGTLTLTGNSAINRLLVKSVTPGAQRILTAASNSISNADFQDIKFAGAQSKDLRAIAGFSGDCGGNDTAGGMQFTDAAAQTWTHGASASYNWSDSTRWTSRVPLPQDDVIFGVTSFGAAGKTVVADMPRLGKDIDWTNATNSPTWTLSTTTNSLYGSLTLIAAMTKAAGNQQLWFSGREAGLTITNAGKQFYMVYISAPGGVYTLTDAMIASYKIQVDSGSFISAGKSISYTYGFISSGSLTRTVDLTGSTITQTSAIASAAYNWNFDITSNLTFSAPDTISITYSGATDCIFTGGGLTYKDISMAPGSGTTVFSGNFTFANMTMSSAGTKTVKFTENTTYTMTGTNFLSGTAGNIVTVISKTSGSVFTLSKTGGSYISSDYLSLKDSAATPRATWYAGTHSTDVSGNSGWIFSDPIVISNAGGNWSAGASWVGGVVPTATDSVFASPTSGDITIDSDASVRDIDLTNYQGTLTHNAGVTLSIGDGSGGSLTFGSGMTYTPVNNSISIIRFVSTTTGNNITWAEEKPGSIIFDGAGGNWIFQDPVTINGNLTINNSDTVGNGVDFNNQPVTVSRNFLMNAGKLTAGPSPFSVTGSRTVSGGTVVDSTTSYNYFKLSLDTATHNDYGVSYPITYKFNIPSSSANLKVYKKYNVSDSWSQISEKTSMDFFNAIEAARFDYANNVAYITVAFSNSSDNIYLKISDNSENIVKASYQGIPTYYDNRQAAVTVTSDGWDGDVSRNIAFKNAADAFSSRRIWFTPGVVTRGVRFPSKITPPPTWSEIQSKIDQGYIEIASHSAEHLAKRRYSGTYTGADNETQTMTDSLVTFPIGIPPVTFNFVGWTIDNTTDGSSCLITASTVNTVTCAGGLSGGVENDWDNGDNYAIDQYDEEISGSRDDITNNLNLSSLNRKGNKQYVYAYIEPFGTTDDPITHSKLGDYKYLIARTVGTENIFSEWDAAASTYNRIGNSYLYSDSNTIDIPNFRFDSAVDAGGIYHVWTHPYSINWDPGSRILDHLDYIKDRKDLWYVGFGHLYLYHYIMDQNKVSVAKVKSPDVTAQAASSITYDSAVFNGNIISVNGDNATTRGFKYYAAADCTGFENNKSENGDFGTGTFSQTITGLQQATTYSYLVYATNPAGTGTSSCQQFSTASVLSPPGSSTSSPSSTIPTPSQLIESIRNYFKSTPWPSFITLGEKVSNSDITFDASGYLSDKKIIKYEWVFGDGTSGNGMRIIHRYKLPGRYEVKLNVTDNAGNKYTTSQFIDIKPSIPTIDNIKAQKKDLLIDGHSDPNTIVYFTIQSQPFEGKGLADEKGYWTFNLENADKVIGEGDHTVNAIAAIKLNDNSELRSQTSKKYDFKLTIDNDKILVEMRRTRIWKIISGILGLVAITFFLFSLRKKRKLYNR